MSDLFDKFVFDLQRFANSTVIAFSEIGNGSFSWASDEATLIAFAAGSTSTANLSIDYTSGSPNTITALNGVTLVGDGHHIIAAGLSSGEEGSATGPVNIYNASGGSVAFGETSSKVTFNFAASGAGSEYFVFDSENSGVTYFDFTKQGAGLNYNEEASGGILNGLTYNGGKSFGADFMIQGGNDVWLKRTSDTEFVASGLSYSEDDGGNGVFLTNELSIQVVENSTGSAAVSFSVKGNDGVDTFTGATVGAGAGIQVEGMSSKDLKINGDAVNVNTVNYQFTRIGGTSAIDLSGLSSTPAEGIVVSKTGNAAQVGLSALSGANVTIVEDAFTANVGASFFFEVDSEGATGVSGIATANDSVTGAFFKREGFTFNGESVGLTTQTPDNTYTYSLNTLSGLVNGDEITEAGSISKFITKAIKNKATFGVLSSAVSFAGNDDDGVEFNFNGGNFAGVSGLNKGLSVAGDFTNNSVTVNGQSLATTDDSLILYGMGASNPDATGIGMIDGFTGGSTAAAEITDAGGASQIITDKAGLFLVGSQSFGTEGDDEITFMMGASTVVEGISGFGGEPGTDAILTGALSTVWINAKDNKIAVNGDDDNEFTFMYRGETEKYVLGGVSGDNVVINGIAGADIVQVTGSGSYAFNLPDGGLSATFEVALGGDSNGVEFLFKDGKLLGISSLDEGAAVYGDFSGSAIAIYGYNTTSGSQSSTTVQVTGDSYVGVEHDAFMLTKLSDGAYIVQATGISVAYTDAFVGASSITITDASGDVFTFKAPGAGDSVMLLLDGQANIIGVSALDAGVTLEGGLSALTTINGQSFAITGDDDFGVVGSQSAQGIGIIFNLGGDSVTITNAGGASQIITDDVGSFFFADNAQNGIEISGDSSVTFGLSAGQAAYVTSIDGLSGTAEADHTLFENGGISVNGQTINITGDSGTMGIAGTTDESGIERIFDVGGESVVVNSAGGASLILTDKDGTFTFASASQVVTISGDSEVSFVMDTTQAAALSGIENLGASGYAEATSDLFTAAGFSVNGQAIDISGDSGTLKLYGEDSNNGLTKITDVGGTSAVNINAVGGASIVETDLNGEFVFGGGQSFIINNDSNSSVQFQMDTASESAAVLGINNFEVNSGESGYIQGQLQGVDINNSGLSIAVEGDADNIFQYIIDDQGQTILGGVGASSASDLVVIKGTGGASIVRIMSTGYYQFGEGGSSYFLNVSASDTNGVDFYLQSADAAGLSVITKINSFDKGDIITGDFQASAVSFAGMANGAESTAVVQVLGDSSITVEHDAFLLKDISNGATITSAEGVYEAWTDKFEAGALSIAIQDADSHNFSLVAAAAGQSVMFALDGQGHIYGVSALADGVTLTGSESALEGFAQGTGFNGMSVIVSGDTDGFGVVGSASGEAGAGITSIINLTGGASVAMAGGASYAFTDNNGEFTFTNGEFKIEDDNNSVQFVFDPSKNKTAADVKGISAFVGKITLDSALVEAAFEINGLSLDIRNDDDVMTITTTSESGIAAISQIGAASAGTVGIFNAGGASQITTDKVGGFSFATSGQLFKVYGDSSVEFVLNASTSAVTGINNFAGESVTTAVVLGPLNGIEINGDSAIDVQVNGSASGVNLAYGPYEGAYYLGTYGTSAGASVAINKVAQADYFFTSNTGEFTFAGNSTATFTVAGDSSVVFSIDDNVAATGVSYLGMGASSGDLEHVGGNVAATITGQLAGFTINNSSESIAVTNDADDIFSYAVDNSGIGSGMNATLGNISGSGTVEITGTGGASVVEIIGAGSYAFFGAQEFKYESASGTFSEDGVAQFVLNGTSVAAINSFNKGDTVSGDFSSLVEFNQGASAGLDQATVQVSGDSFISVIYDDIIIRNLSDSATFVQVRGISEAWTDALNASASSIEVTDEVGNKFKVSGTSDADGVKFLVKEDTGEIYGVESLDEGVTLEGSLAALSSINGRTFDITGDDDFGVVGSAGASGIGVIFNLGGDSVVINDAGGASQIYTDKEGVFYFADNAAAPSGVSITSDAEVVFGLDTGASAAVLSIDSLSGFAEADNGLFAAGLSINGKSIDISGDEGILAVKGTSAEDGIDAILNVGGSAVVINAMGGASYLVTDKVGEFTFASASQTITLAGDSEIQFTVNDSEVVQAINGLSALGNVEADNTLFLGESAITVNGKVVDIDGDENTLKLWGKDDNDGITIIDNVGGSSTVSVNAVAGATTVRTDMDGDFYFATKGQNFYVKDTVDAVTDFLMDGSQSAFVTGIEGLSEGTIIFNTVTTALSVNTLEYAAQNMSFGTTSSVTLTVDPYQVVAVSGITAQGYVSGVVGNGDAATVWAEGPVTVNGKYIDITDDDNDFGIIVRSGSSSTEGTPEEAFNVTGDATVNVADFTVTADGNGEFTIGGESFTFEDAEKDFKFTTDEAKALNSVSALSGTLVDHDGNVDLDGFNGDGAIKVTNDEEVTLGGDGNYLTSISELNDGAVVDGDLDNASVAVATNDDTVAVTVNDNPYTFIGDEDGVTIIGANDKGIGRVVGLDEGASLKIAVAGDYSVNKVDSSDATTVLSAKVGDIIIGSDGGTNAYIYDGSNPLIREKTPLDVIEGITGIPSGGYSSVGGNSTTTAHPINGIPLNIAESDIIQGFRSASSADTLYPYVTSRDEYRDTLDLDQPLEIWIDNKESPVDTNQDLDLSKTRYAKKVHLFGGTQSVEFNDEGGNLAHIESVASGHKTIDLGDGGDVVVMDEPSAVGNSVNIIGGLKNDSIFVRDSANTTVDVSAGGADKIITYAGAGARVTVVGYEPSMEGGIRIDELQSTDMLAAIMGQSSGLNINFGDGVVSIEHTSYDKHSEISLGADANNATFVNLFDYKNNAYPVGFTGIDGGTLDVGITENDPLILVGNYKGNKTAGSVILGGAGPDVVLAGGMDSVDARGGNNTVILENDADREGAVIAFTQGRTVVYGMNNTLAASTGDTIVLSANNIKNFKFDGEDVTIDGNGFYGILEDVDAVEDTRGGKFVTQYIYNSDNSTVYKAAGAVENGTIYLPKDEDLRPNAFFGKNSGIDFGDYADPQTVMIDLKGDMAESSIGGSPIYTRGITGLYGYYYDYYDNPVATTENLIFKGSDANDTLIAGNGNTSLYGDGGKNWLVGSYDYDNTLSDKEGRVTFFVIGNANGAANTISNFEYVSDDNYKDTSRVTADQIEILEEQSEVVYADVSGNDVYIEVASFGGENKESVVLQNAIDTLTGYGKDFIVSGNVAQVGKDKVLVDRFGEFYMATEKNATINVEEEGSPVTVWLDNPETGKTFRGDFAVIDASTLTSNAQLAGRGNKENTIIGGYGNNSLWGGEGSSNDMLIGGEGKNTFFYGLGNGQDTVEANDGDEVVLGISIDDIVESQSSIGDTSLTLKLRDGGSLTVNDGGGIVDYKLTNSEGVQETYYLDSNRQFKQR